MKTFLTKYNMTPIYISHFWDLLFCCTLHNFFGLNLGGKSLNQASVVSYSCYRFDTGSLKHPIYFTLMITNFILLKSSRVILITYWFSFFISPVWFEFNRYIVSRDCLSRVVCSLLISLLVYYWYLGSLRFVSSHNVIKKTTPS